MTEITAAMVKELREKTGAGVLDCKNALAEAGGDIERAVEILREKGLADAAKRMGREANEGIIGSYVHAGSRVAALVELNCETDFVARTEEFQALAHDLAMQVVAARPLYLTPEDIPEEVLEREREIYRAQVADSGKPEHVIERIVQGKLEKFLDEVCLMRQPFIKDDSMTVEELIRQAIARLGENIVVRRFARLAVGEE
ncbi:MAG: translation elongation factor Ts [Anaerolineae bacterium]|nr:translation elongation factor Ts [Anaerolineae bacterium]